MYICIYVCMYVHIYTYRRTHTHTHTLNILQQTFFNLLFQERVKIGRIQKQMNTLPTTKFYNRVETAMLTLAL